MSAAPGLIVLSGGGHARVLIDVLRRAGRAVLGVTDANPALSGTQVEGVAVLGDDDAVLGRDPAAVELVNGLGNAAGGGASGVGPRRALFDRFRAKGFHFATVVSADAVVSAGAVLGEGAQVLTRAVVHPGCRIGANAVVNTGAQVDHDCAVGAHSHVAPGAVLCGNVAVGEGCHVGAGAVILQGVAVGDGAVVGAGAVVVADVAPGATVVGNPARPR